VSHKKFDIANAEKQNPDKKRGGQNPSRFSLFIRRYGYRLRSCCVFRRTAAMDDVLSGRLRILGLFHYTGECKNAGQ
jgi:hypothetical protein